ncbi:hypothetical protein LP420_35895 [Massilia sp. B-10]|nr:hypothetical protein LP420_35895 [Massilia sp. B-10]UUZ53815.1 hypothetical protein LP419_35330 [Massilia sp. H-1]
MRALASSTSSDCTAEVASSSAAPSSLSSAATRRVTVRAPCGASPTRVDWSSPSGARRPRMG